jgi:Sec-independent protein translocase protein TatA
MKRILLALAVVSSLALVAGGCKSFSLGSAAPPPPATTASVASAANPQAARDAAAAVTAFKVAWTDFGQSLSAELPADSKSRQAFDRLDRYAPQVLGVAEGVTQGVRDGNAQQVGAAATVAATFLPPPWNTIVPMVLTLLIGLFIPSPISRGAPAAPAQAPAPTSA